MTLEEEMALAVLRGDPAAARALADRLCENERAGVLSIAPVKEITVPFDRVRVIVQFPLEDRNGNEVMVQDPETMKRAVEDWLRNGTTLAILGAVSVRVYQLPEGFVPPAPRGELPHQIGEDVLADNGLRVDQGVRNYLGEQRGSSFTDSQGRTWRRQDFGNMRLSPPPLPERPTDWTTPFTHDGQPTTWNRPTAERLRETEVRRPIPPTLENVDHDDD